MNAVPFGQHARVGGGHVGVGAEHRRDPAVEMPAHRLLLAGGLGVEVDQDHLDLVGETVDQTVGLLERRVERRHEDLPFEVDGGDRDPGRGLADVEPAPGIAVLG